MDLNYDLSKLVISISIYLEMVWSYEIVLNPKSDDSWAKELVVVLPRACNRVMRELAQHGQMDDRINVVAESGFGYHKNALGGHWQSCSDSLLVLLGLNHSLADAR